MPLPPLYKFLDVRGAKLTLRNGTFKHSNPRDFNDVDDLTVNSVFPVTVEEATDRFQALFIDVLLENLDREPKCPSPMREQLKLIQRAMKHDPSLVDRFKEEFEADNEPPFDVEHLKFNAIQTLGKINEFLCLARVFCVSTLVSSSAMWEEYAESHKGIALRIVPNVERDSKFRLFRPVEYRGQRPSLFSSVREFIGGLFEDSMEYHRSRLDTIIYTKTLEWQHESEYRLVIHLRPDEPLWNTDGYHPDEITELYLGAAMQMKDMAEIVTLARLRNPKIAIFRSNRTDGGEVVFEPF